MDDEAPALGFGACDRCAAPTASPPYVISPGDSCPLPATLQARAQVISSDGPQPLNPEDLSEMDQAALVSLASRLRLDWTGSCECTAGEPFEPVSSFELIPVAPASSRHGFWASAIRHDGLAVALSSAHVHVFTPDGTEHRSEPIAALSVDGIVPLPDGRFVVWGVDDSRPVSVSTRTLIVDVTDPSAPFTVSAAVIGWPQHASFRLREWHP